MTSNNKTQGFDGFVSNDPPKVKTDKTDEAILNKQDDNSYEEPVTENMPKKKETEAEDAKNTDFEYADDGEFQNGAQVTNTDTKEAFL